MTAPVVTVAERTSGPEANVTMYFLVPFDLQAAPPAPTDPAVYIAKSPQFSVYVRLVVKLSKEKQ